MKRNFADEAWVDRDLLRELQQRANGPGIRRLTAQLALYALSAAGMMLGSEAWVVWSSFAVNALVQFGMFGMLHESCHQTAFASRSWNLLAGWVAALGQPMTPALMRAFHFEHHRHTHELEKDPELAGMSFMVGWPRHVMWLMTVSGLPVLLARFGWTLFAALVPAGGAWDKVSSFRQAGQASPHRVGGSRARPHPRSRHLHRRVGLGAAAFALPRNGGGSRSLERLHHLRTSRPSPRGTHSSAHTFAACLGPDAMAVVEHALSRRAPRLAGGAL